ncbi:hypothetical protein [Streptomyces sp. NPDC058625]|uniref:hypothetical protein n=1 Tax=Streptomyces sp. NPDC058625 TaxID=3346564 RepID=UPI003648F216
MLFERLPGHRLERRPDVLRGGRSFQGGEAFVVPAQPAFDVLDVLDVLAEFEGLAAVFAARGDQGVEHRHDRPAEDVGDALADAVLEADGLCRGRVVHRLCAGQVLHAQEIHTHLTCDFAVPEELGDVEDGAAGPDGEGRARLCMAIGTQVEFLEIPQF